MRGLILVQLKILEAEVGSGVVSSSGFYCLQRLRPRHVRTLEHVLEHVLLPRVRDLR